MGHGVPDVPVPDRVDWVPAWDSLDDAQKQFEARRMEIYAAMVESLDDNIGRLLDYLKRTGQYENTVILFSSDNGAEGNNIGTMYENEDWIPTRFDNRYENMGRISSYVWTGPAWAQAQGAPFRLFKTHPTEGGTRTPAIVRLSGLAHRGHRMDTFASVKDVAPTLLELAGVEHPSVYDGREVAPMQGKSMVSFLGRNRYRPRCRRRDGLGALGRRGVLKGHWKLVWLWEPYGVERWELFDLSSDPSESRDLSEEAPEKLQELLRDWEDYVHENKVILPGRDMGYGLLDGASAG